MTGNENRAWVEHYDTLTNLFSTRLTEEIWAGGRFVCQSDTDEDKMAAFLTGKGLCLRDTGQCEMVASRAVIVSEARISSFISEMRRLAADTGYRLVSVEVGNFESGAATVLASEGGYVPW